MTFRGSFKESVTETVVSSTPEKKRDPKCIRCGTNKSSNQRSKKKGTDSLFPDIYRPMNHRYEKE